ncbi:MAG: phosphoribosylglycinamide formyltransferase [Candidatus Diapherotrites archaeon]|nr:phosphoribosylglycinamide formyltransferase [Candidatus Diapherotrites archaeon]
MKSMLRLAILGSTRGTDMQAIINAIEHRLIDARIEIVISNVKDAYILERARKHNIKAIFLSPAGKTPQQFDEELIKLIEKHNCGLILLIGYNKILTKKFVERFYGKAINIHPSLLPSFKGWDKNVHREVLNYGCKVSGCTLHFITEKPDEGPIIMQKCVPVKENDTVETLKARVQKAEQEVLIKALELFAKGKIRLSSSGRVMIQE